MQKLLLLLSAGCMAMGCIVVDDDDRPYYYIEPDPYLPPEPIRRLPIDADVFIEATPGVGAGVFIEYESSGLWHVYATCDTEVSSLGCEWDIVASVPRSTMLELIDDIELEREDVLTRVDEGALRLWTFTTFDFDGFSFQAPAGDPVRFDILLDALPAPRFVSWIGGGGLQQGAPSNPFELEPRR